MTEKNAIKELATLVEEEDTAGTVNQSEADELREFTKELRTDVIAWLKATHPSLISSP